MTLIKYGDEKLHKKLYKLMNDAWKNEKITKEWEEEIVLTIHKKGDNTYWL